MKYHLLAFETLVEASDCHKLRDWLCLRNQSSSLLYRVGAMGLGQSYRVDRLVLGFK